MQYLLTHEEYEELTEHNEKLDDQLSETLQDLCTKVADHMPSRKPYNWKEGDALEPWGCILTVKREWYCDDCPVRKVCPNKYKELSQ